MFFRKLFHQPLIVTHNSQFHSDDICAVATLHILLKGRYCLIRTRDPKIIEKADYVVDVGGIHDPEKNRFDHHQKGGAGNRQNGIPYAAFGLVWKTYGEKLSGSAEAAQSIDENIIAAGDAHDNGFLFIESRIKDIHPYEFGAFLSSFNPFWNEKQDFDGQFRKAVAIVVPMLERAIKREKSSEEGNAFAEVAYKNSVDKKIIILDAKYPWQDAIISKHEPLYVLSQNSQDSNWHVRAVPIKKSVFDVRKPFPVEWAGLRDADLAKVSGVADAVFCHNKLFLVVAKSRDGALALAKKAVER